MPNQPSTCRHAPTLSLLAALASFSPALAQTPRSRWTEPTAPSEPLPRRPDAPTAIPNAAAQRTVVSDALLQALHDYNDPRVAIAVLVVHAEKEPEGLLQHQGIATTLGEGIKGYLNHPQVRLVAASPGTIDAITNFSTLARTEPTGAAVALSKSLGVDLVMLITLTPNHTGYRASYSIVDTARSQTLGAWSFDLVGAGGVLDAARLRDYSAQLARAFAEDFIRAKDATRSMTLVVQGLSERDLTAVRESVSRAPGVGALYMQPDPADNAARTSFRIVCTQGTASAKPSILEAIRAAASTPVRVVADEPARLALEAAPFQAVPHGAVHPCATPDAPPLAQLLREAGNPRFAVLFAVSAERDAKPKPLTVEEHDLRASLRDKLRRLGATLVDLDVANARLRQDARDAAANANLALTRQLSEIDPYDIAIIVSGEPAPNARYTFTAQLVASGRVLADCTSAFAMDAVASPLTPAGVERLAANAASRLEEGLRHALSTPTPMTLRVSNLWMNGDVARIQLAFAKIPGVRKVSLHGFKVDKADGFATLHVSYFGEFTDLLIAMQHCQADLPFDFDLQAATPEQLNLRLKDR